jgi:hypothetical protein
LTEQTAQDQEKALADLTTRVMQQLHKGVKKPALVKQLVKSKWSEENAVKFVDKLEAELIAYKESPEGRAVLASGYKRRMWKGLAWLIGGILFTVIAYMMASKSGGGRYLITYGAVIYGLIEFFGSLGGWNKYKPRPGD